MGEQRGREAPRDRERAGLRRGGRVDHDREIHSLLTVRGRRVDRAPERDEEIVRLLAGHLRGELRVGVHRDVVCEKRVRRAVSDGIGFTAIEELHREVGPWNEVEGLDDDVLAVSADLAVDLELQETFEESAKRLTR